MVTRKQLERIEKKIILINLIFVWELQEVKTSAGVDPVKYMLLAVIYLPGVKAGFFLFT